MNAAAAPTLNDDRAALAQQVRPVTLARDRRIAVAPPLDALLPEGLTRGTAVALGARPGVAGATSLALALAAGPSQDGAWVAVVGARWLGLAAAADTGLRLERLVVVDAGRRGAQVASVVAALVDGFDVVLVGPDARGRLRRGDTRRLLARVRERSGVLVAMGDDLPGGVAQVRLQVTASTWEGLDKAGGGYLQRCLAVVEATGRGAASRPRRAELLLRGGLSARGNSCRSPEPEAMAVDPRLVSPPARRNDSYDLGLGA